LQDDILVCCSCAINLANSPGFDSPEPNFKKETCNKFQHRVLTFHHRVRTFHAHFSTECAHFITECSHFLTSPHFLTTCSATFRIFWPYFFFFFFFFWVLDFTQTKKNEALWPSLKYVISKEKKRQKPKKKNIFRRKSRVATTEILKSQFSPYIYSAHVLAGWQLFWEIPHKQLLPWFL